MTDNYEYIVVGSGAGGGTVAARLAESGHTVLLLEAGSDAKTPEQGSAGDASLPEDYDVPAFHAFSSENDRIAWDFFVRHYGDTAQQKRDDKYRDVVNAKHVDGVLYPRAGTLGGCTAHNAMITVYPHNADWDHIAQLTGDESWSAQNMRKIFQRLERCEHRAFPYRWLNKFFGINPTGHGWDGWLQTEKSIPPAALDDKALVKVISDAVAYEFENSTDPLRRLKRFVKGQGDPNDLRSVSANAEGIFYTPLANARHRRLGTRERLLDVAARFPGRLHIELNALATRVILDASNQAVGVEYLKGERLYRAHSRVNAAEGERHEARAKREVILAGGAFNTPQLLMLSGIGPRETLTKFGIPVRVAMDGVGKNLQDRYEVGVVHRMDFPEWHVLRGAQFKKGDPQFAEWDTLKRGVYATNGAVLGLIRRSTQARELPDLFCFALLGAFRGYFPGYSKLFATHRNYLTWAVLKAHTNNRKGEVTLRSTDPRDTPEINFHYFGEGTNDNAEDLDSVVEGIKYVRRTMGPLKRANLVAEEELPGAAVQTDDQLRQFVRDNAWGHHASCTCPIGPAASGGVLSPDFRVHGTSRLRVVDASVFPRIPGFFIASAVYMIAEKAADAILVDAGIRPNSA
ncbi:MAG: GMC family oxidoreductase [Usitatibacteraceae bacterium]